MEQGADFAVCRDADPDGPAPTPALAADYNRGWRRVRGPAGTLRLFTAALGAVDAALKAADPCARRAALRARETALEAEIGAVRRDLASLPPSPPDGNP